jgi:hypothetical protein
MTGVFRTALVALSVYQLSKEVAAPSLNHEVSHIKVYSSVSFQYTIIFDAVNFMIRTYKASTSFQGE